MSDYDRNKYFRRTKFYQAQRDSGHAPHYPTRPYSKNTLFKYDREYKDTEKSNESKEKPIQQPTILLKARSERSLSPKRSTKENEPPPTPTTITTHDNTATSHRVMTESLKLIEDGSLSPEVIQEYLHDSPDFLVVGILGSQGVGKSTVMNLIAQNIITNQFKNDLFNFTTATPNNLNESIKILTDNVANLKVVEEDSKHDNSKESKLNNILFKPQSLDQIETGNYGTNGIDMYITSNRVFLLDCQPVVSSGILDEIVQNDFKKTTVAGEFLPVENCAEIQSLQYATFLLSVCHVVILVQDWFFDSNFVRFLQTAEMLKPSIPTTAEEDYMEYFPHVLMVHNRATMEDFTPIRFKIMQQVYHEVFSKSKLRFDSGMGLGTGKIMHSLSPTTCGDPFNLFLLPEYEDTKDAKYRGHPPFEDLVRELRGQIHSVTRIPLLSAQLSERNWLQFASKVWDTIKKSSFFLEYSRLMP